MNEDEMEAIEPFAGEELERMLGRYARVRLDPSPAQVRRARMAVMEEASRRQPVASTRVAAAAPRKAEPARRTPFAGWTTRRIAASLSAAVLAGLMIGTSTFAASRAGGPLYEARVALEVLTLPGSADARLDAEVTQAQSRLAEVIDASARNDPAALDAALAAYSAAIDRMRDIPGEHGARALEAVRFHRSVLLGVLGASPASAVAGLDRALAASDRVITRFESAGAGPSDGGGGSGGGSTDGSGGGNAGNGNGAGAGPDKSPKPAKTARPDKTPSPARTQKPGKADPSKAPANPNKPTPRP